MTSAETHGSPDRTVVPPNWTRVGVASLAALTMILSGCTGSPSGVAGPPAGANASESSGEPTEAQAQPSGSAESRSPASDSSAGPSARASESSSGKDGKTDDDSSAGPSARTSEPPSGKDGRTDDDSSAEKPTLEPRPEADLSDEEIRDIYTDDAEPGRTVTATLCNLHQGRLDLLEKHIVSRDGIDDSNLRLALISLGDLLGVWEGLTWQLPEAAADIETAREVYASWDFALALQESGDSAGAQEQLDAASEAIDRLPADPDAELGCGG